MVIKEFTRRRIEKDKNHKRGRNRMENSPHETIHEKFYIFLWDYVNDGQRLILNRKIKVFKD